LAKDKTASTLKVLFDASFLFTPSQFNVDIFEELARVLSRRFEPIVISSTYEELQTIVRIGSEKTRRQAALALQIAEKCRRVTVKRKAKESHDDVIVRIASKIACLVATNDKELRKRLRDRGIAVVYLRQKTRLAVDGVV
jgi:rRNA-processing protein FCF1